MIHCIPFFPHTYDSLHLYYQQKVSREAYEDYITWYNHCSDMVVEQFLYPVQDCEVVGIMAKPAHFAGKKLPVIVYNRGGWGDISKITVSTIKEKWHPFVQQGYVLIGSQYRGVDGGTGKEDFGGEDVHDVTALWDVLKTLDYIDINNVFMIGGSRGGMMTYKALKAGVPVNAVAVIAGLADLCHSAGTSNDNKKLLDQLVVVPEERRQQEYQERSVVHWPEYITVPVLLLHAENDPTVPVEQSRKVFELFHNLKKECKLIVYPSASHGLDDYQGEVVQEIMAWFARFRK